MSAAQSRRDEPSATILHVSDTQFGEFHRFDDVNGSLASHLIVDLRKLLRDEVPSIDLIVLSGDIAETGKKAEFDQAKAFVEAICAATNLDHDRVVVVPGNHDVNRAACRAYFNDCESDDLQPSEPYVRKWKHYQSFVTWLHGEGAFTEEQPYRLHRFDDLRLAVAAMNSTMRESHRDEDHFGWCGDEQLRWYESQLRPLAGYARIGVVHHNARRKAQADDENLRDEDALTNIVGPHLDLLLHGHTHDGKEDRLADGMLVLATGSAALTAKRRPDEVPNQYQIVRLRPKKLTRWARQWDGKGHWIADPRISRSGNNWRVDVHLEPPGWSHKPDSINETGVRRTGGADFVARVELVTRRDLGEARIEKKEKGTQALHYLIATRRAAPMRCVGIVDGPLDLNLLERFDSTVFGPLREHGGVEFVIVHCGPDEPALRIAAQHRGVRVKTWTEYNDLLEPSAYRDWLLRKLEFDELYPQKLYLSQRFRTITRWGAAGGDIRDDLLSEVYDTILAEDGKFVLVLGDAGYGKSFLVRRLAYRMLRHERTNITPIVIYLRDRDKRQTIDEMVSAVLIESRAVFNADRFRHSLEAGSIALLIDGYDEFAVRVGYQNAAAQLQTFIDAQQGRAKVMLTTRPNHFRSADEVTTALFDKLRTVHDGQVYQLEPFDEDQQRAFLTRCFQLRGDTQAPGTAAHWMGALTRVGNLPELAKTPRMLSFMVEDLSLAEIETAAQEGTVTAADLYQRLLDHWLSQEASKVDAEDQRNVPPAQRQRVLEELAFVLWRIGERDVSETVLHKVVRDALDLSQLDMTLDQATQLVGGRTLLKVDDRRWRFAHQSVGEFLLAKCIAALLRAGDNDDKLGEAELTALTIRFLRDIAPDEATAWAERATGGPR